VGDWDADEMGWGVEDRARRCSERDVNLIIEVWLVQARALSKEMKPMISYLYFCRVEMSCTYSKSMSRKGK
jgi:hypothetical protein